MSTYTVDTIIEALEAYKRGDGHQWAIEAAIDVLRKAGGREAALKSEHITRYERLSDKNLMLHIQNLRDTVDATRYRYLRDIRRRDCLTLNGPDAGVWCDAEDEDGNLMLLTEDDLDAAIDAATAKERK